MFQWTLDIRFQCVPVSGLGFRRGSYKCVCKTGYYFPVGLTGESGGERTSLFEKAYFNGTVLEEEYENVMKVSEILADTMTWYNITSSELGRSEVEYSVESCNSYQTVKRVFLMPSGKFVLVLSYISCVKTRHAKRKQNERKGKIY